MNSVRIEIINMVKDNENKFSCCKNVSIKLEFRQQHAYYRAHPMAKLSPLAEHK